MMEEAMQRYMLILLKVFLNFSAECFQEI